MTHPCLPSGAPLTVRLIYGRKVVTEYCTNFGIHVQQSAVLGAGNLATYLFRSPCCHALIFPRATACACDKTWPAGKELLPLAYLREAMGEYAALSLDPLSARLAVDELIHMDATLMVDNFWFERQNETVALFGGEQVVVAG